MNRVLLIRSHESLDPAFEPALNRAGFAIAGHADGAAMVRKTSELGPSHLLAVDLPLDELLAMLDAWAGMPPAAVGVLCAPLAGAAHEKLVAAGVHAWAPFDARDGTLEAADVAILLARAGARWQRESGLRKALANSLAQLDERKWIDRAKGLLMAARGIDEDEAFGLLRNASMHANLRLGEVSRSVLDAARWAEAINRSGQLRMLSQRLVRLAAQRLARIESRRSRELQTQSAGWIDDNLKWLSTLTLDPAAIHARERADRVWKELQQALDVTLTPASLRHVDASAESLLAAAEALTLSLETAGGRHALRLVNICGGQRMRAHRVAKDALLGSLLTEPPEGPWRGRLAATAADFEAALIDLERAPLSSPDTRSALATARDEWLRLLRGADAADSAEGRATLVRGSEALAKTFDDLTAAYEHSLQVIMS
jgi:AmiR/NasT family two-component response regulator